MERRNIAERRRGLNAYRLGGAVLICERLSEIETVLPIDLARLRLGVEHGLHGRGIVWHRKMLVRIELLAIQFLERDRATEHFGNIPALVGP